MSQRFVSVWFRYLSTDWFTRRQPGLKDQPFVLAIADHGRLLVSAASQQAMDQGIYPGMTIADARIIIPTIPVLDHKPGLQIKLLQHLAEYCIRFTPVVAIDASDSLILDASGCAHLWGGEQRYLSTIINRLNWLGYEASAAIADTIGTAWALTHYGNDKITAIAPGEQAGAMLGLPPAALRIEKETVDRLHKLGLRQISQFMGMPRFALRRRFGSLLIERLNQALGNEQELIQPVHPPVPYHERLASLEPIVTRTGIELALEQLLELICSRLSKESKGLRTAVFKCFRIDNKTITIDIGTNRPTHNKKHLVKLFENKLDSIDPGLGIEVFTLDAPQIGDVMAAQEKFWDTDTKPGVYELLDRIAGKFGKNRIHRYLPDEHYWPERSARITHSPDETPTLCWTTDRARPIQLLSTPESISVTAPIPDYPPMLFRYKGKLHKIIRADGPERLEQEWWLQQGEHRDYYVVEDEEGCRYWLFRSGHYTGDKRNQWFLHGFFA